MAARTQVRRFGVNVNQAVRELGHSTIITIAHIYAHVPPVLPARGADAVAELVAHARRAQPQPLFRV